MTNKKNHKFDVCHVGLGFRHSHNFSVTLTARPVGTVISTSDCKSRGQAFAPQLGQLLW